MNRSTLGIALLGVAALGAVTALTVQQIIIRNRPVDSYGIIIRANSTQLTPDQWIHIQTVLGSIQTTAGVASRDMLYRVREFRDNGTTDFGKMLENQMLVSETAILNTLPKNFTGHAFQIGLGGKEQSEEFPKGQTNMPQGHYRQNMIESKNMVDAVDKILYP